LDISEKGIYNDPIKWALAQWGFWFLPQFLGGNMMKGKLILLFAGLLMLGLFLTAYGLGDQSSSGATSGSQDQTMSNQSTGSTGSEQGTSESEQGTTGTEQGTTGSDQGTTESQGHEATESQEEEQQESTGSEDQGTMDNQRDGSTMLKEDGDSQYQDKLTMSDQKKSSSFGKDAGTMEKDQGTADVQESLKKAGISDTKIQQWKALFNTPFYTNSPMFVLGLKDSLKLTSDQQQRLTQLNDQTRSQAQQILTKDQRDKLSKYPTQQFTLHDLHVEACQKVQQAAKNQQSSGQSQSCKMNCPLCPSQSRDTGSSSGIYGSSSADSSSAQKDISGSSGSYSSQQQSAGISSMGKDRGTAEVQQKLRNAGVSDEKIQQWQGIMNAPIYTNSPGFLLGMKDTLGLTSDQQQRLTSLNDQTRTQVDQILTKDQRDRLAKLPTQQFTLRELHSYICQKMQSSQQSSGQTCPSMNCPLCPSKSRDTGTSAVQQDGSSSVIEQPTTQPYQQR
jgi:ribosomal protein S3